MNQPANLNNLSKPMPKQALNTTGAISLTIMLVSLVAYMMKTGQVNIVMGGLVIITGVISGIAWGKVLGSDAEA